MTTKVNRLITLFSLTVLIVVFSSCGENASDTMDPDEVVVITSIQLQRRDSSPDTEIPELKKIPFDVLLEFNMGEGRKMTDAELDNLLIWDASSQTKFFVIKCNDTPGAIKLQGQETVEIPQDVDVNVRYKADNSSGKKELLSNSIPITIIKAELLSIEVKPASEYSLGCNLSTENNTRLVEGCLMQFQTVGYYDNDVTVDLTDSLEVTWSSTNEDLADLVENIDLSTDITEEWGSYIRDYLTDNNLTTKKGLVLGRSIGGFTIEAEYQGEESTSEEVSVIGPSLKIVTVSIPGKCPPDGLCQLYDNTTVQFKALGIYGNNLQEDVTYSSTWSSSNGLITFPLTAGFAQINGSSPANITVNAEAGGVTDTLTVNVDQEILQEIQLDIPDINSIDRMSNTDIQFRVKGIFNNDAFDILNTNDRQESLNLDQIEWTSTNQSVAFVDNENENMADNWSEEGAVIIKTTDVENGSADISVNWKTGEEMFAWTGFSWTITIDNTSSTPVFLTISPSDSSGDLTAEAGTDIQFSAVATFSNGKSHILDNSSVTWSSDLGNCIIYSSEPCISASGLATTYNDLQITATFDGSNDISTNLDLWVENTQLENIIVIPANQSVRELTTIQYTAVGQFSNNKSHNLPDNCVNWNVSTDNSIAVINSQGVLTTIDETDDVLVTATTVSDCGGSEPAGRDIPEGMSGDTLLNIIPLPRVNFQYFTRSFNEDYSSLVTVTIIADSTFDGDITVPFVVSGTSTTEDHDLESELITIYTGSYTGTTTFSIIDDVLDEYNETIKIDISADSIINAKLGDIIPDTTITIQDNDETPDVSFTLADSEVYYEDAGTVYIELKLDPVSGRNVTVDYIITDSSCDSQDHDLTSDSLVISAGQSSAFISFDISNDTWKENNEAFTIAINSAINANIETPQTHTITIIDNDALSITGHPVISCNYPCSGYSFPPDINKITDITADIYNKPDWLNFDNTNGELTRGSGTASDAFGIIICATDSEESVCLPPFDIDVE